MRRREEDDGVIVGPNVNLVGDCGDDVSAGVEEAAVGGTDGGRAVG